MDKLKREDLPKYPWGANRPPMVILAIENGKQIGVPVGYDDHYRYQVKFGAYRAFDLGIPVVYRMTFNSLAHENITLEVYWILNRLRDCINDQTKSRRWK